MGLAASQARLLLLTARKSDLEFRAQQITNSEMILAMQTEEVAREYSNKISNQTLLFIDPSESTESPITAATLGAVTGATGDANKMKLQIKVKNAETGKYEWKDWEPIYDISYVDSNGNEISADDYNKLSDVDKAGYSEKKTIVNNYSGPEILNGVKGGTMQMVYESSGEVVDAINGTAFSVAYNTADDAAAEAEYRRKTSELQIKEKRLQMDLQQVETQQKACETEIDSVKKVMDKNIERTFKVFS